MDGAASLRHRGAATKTPEETPVSHTDYETLFTDVEDGVMTLTLNRPDRLNAFTGQMREDLIAAMGAEDTARMATPVLRRDRLHYEALLEDRRQGRVGGTTAVFDATGRALYFSKEVLPHIDAGALPEPIPGFHHVGVYAYRPPALRAYGGWPSGPLEQLEGLEQLRFLENGEAMLCVEVEARGRVFWELNNPEDVARIEAVLEAS